MIYKIHNHIGEHHKTVPHEEVGLVLCELIPANDKRVRKVMYATSKLLVGEEYIHDYGDTAILIIRIS